MRGRRQAPEAAHLSLGGFGKKLASERLFFGVIPDVAAQVAIATETDALRVEHSLRGRPIDARRLHATLHHLGDHPDVCGDIVEAAVAAAERVSVAPFDVTLASACSFSGARRQHPCVLLCQEEHAPLHVLWRELGTQLMAVGMGRHIKRDFTPHVTLLYDTQVLAPQAIEPIRWTVRDFVLVHSLLGRGEHRILGAWSLK